MEDKREGEELEEEDDNDAAILSLCQRIVSCLVQARAVDRSWANNLVIYVLPEEVDDSNKLQQYDGVTHFDDKETSTANRIGVRVRLHGELYYKRAAVVGTLLHEMAHLLDGQLHDNQDAHPASFYNHYSRIFAAATKAKLFKLPGTMTLSHKTLKRFDAISPFADILDSCLVFELEKLSTKTAPESGPVPVRVTLRHCKYGSTEKVAFIDTTTFTSVHKAFQQKFPKFSTKAGNEFNVTVQGETETYTYTLGNENLHTLKGTGSRRYFYCLS